MAYIVVSVKDQEIGRWPLNLPVTIGRSTECDVVIRDILLSRRHCQITPYRGGWIAADLGSKNGTKCEGKPIARRGLGDGDRLTLGNTTIRFQIGRLAPNHRPPPKRPADPFEALANTVSEFDPKQVEAFRESNNMPAPRPKPREPDSYADEDLYSLLNGIMSSSWDSIYAQASRPRRPIPRLHGLMPAAQAAGGAAVATLPLPRRSRLTFSEDLQADDILPKRVSRPATPQALGLVAARPAAAVYLPFSGIRVHQPANEPRPSFIRRFFRKFFGRA